MKEHEAELFERGCAQLRDWYEHEIERLARLAILESGSHDDDSLDAELVRARLVDGHEFMVNQRCRNAVYLVSPFYTRELRAEEMMLKDLEAAVTKAREDK